MKRRNHVIVRQAKAIDFRIQDGRPALKKKFKISKKKSTQRYSFKTEDLSV